MTDPIRLPNDFCQTAQLSQGNRNVSDKTAVTEVPKGDHTFLSSRTTHPTQLGFRNAEGSQALAEELM